VFTGPFSPLFGPFFRAKRAGPARLGPLRAGLGQKLKPAGSAGPARFWPGFTGPGPGRAGPARLAISTCTLCKLQEYSIDFSPLGLISGISQHTIYLTVFFVLCAINLARLLSLKGCLEHGILVAIPHPLGRNSLHGAFALNTTRAILPYFTWQCMCTTCVILTAIEDSH
jgi:hypothetical protein